ncbi:hypothetical protein SB2_12120 [Methylobacterium radiotolerans]|nr:hypothetical protein SB3_06775 [Methylobacterium radiotolerans]KTS47927.1 hypothetical protein SB2_12120 [Methylobacterium radiotolerans]
MSKPARPTLDSLAGRFARKDTVTPASPAAPEPLVEAEPAATPDASPRPIRAKGDPRVQILTRIDPGTRKRLKVIAAEQERTIQEICEEAIRDFVARHSK